MGALLPGTRLDVSAGGIALRGTLAAALRLNLGLHTASRVLLRLGRFRAAHFNQLERGAADLRWSEVIAPGSGVEFAVTTRKSRLYHTGAISERLLQIVGAQVPGVRQAEPGNATVRIVVRIVRDRVTLSADTSGDHLHERGWRAALGPAPLRETVAAALLMAVGWEPDTPLVDPMCGSGTLLVEGARMAGRRPPGERRTFAMESWPCFDAAVGARIREGLAGGARPVPAALAGRDVRAEAVERARENAAAAEVDGDVQFHVAPVSAATGLPPARPTGCVVANPPWGVRMGGEGELRNLYAALGALVRTELPGWRVGLVCPSERLVAATGLDLVREVSLRQGGINLGLWVGVAPGAE